MHITIEHDAIEEYQVLGLSQTVMRNTKKKINKIKTDIIVKSIDSYRFAQNLKYKLYKMYISNT